MEFFLRKNAIDLRFSIVRNLFFFQTLTNFDGQATITWNCLKELYALKWLFQQHSTDFKSDSGISLPQSILNYCCNPNSSVHLKSLNSGSNTLVRQLLTDGLHQALQEFGKLSQESANICHAIGESLLMTGNLQEAQIYFSKAVDRINDNSLNAYLEEFDNSQTSYLVKYHLVVVDLWGKYKKHSHVIDQCYLALDCCQDKEIQSLFCANIFASALAEQNYDEAYMVITAGENGLQKENCLKNIIQVLCERGQFLKLVEFPYVDILENVENILVDLARRSNAMERPNYYEILYGFLLRRGSYASAANYMYECATRLLEEHLLRDVKPSFIPYSTKGLQEILTFRMDCLNHCSFSLSLSHHRCFTYTPPLRRSNIFQAMSEQVEEVRPVVLGVDSIRREYLISFALSTLLQNDSIQVGFSNVTPEKTLYVLIENEYFDLAFSIAKEFDLNMTPIYAEITRQILHSTNSTLSVRASPVNWDSLKTYLKKFEDKAPKYQFYAEVIEQILTSSPSISPPQWLVDEYEKSFYPSLHIKPKKTSM